MRTIFLLLFTIITQNIFSQNTFKKGYFINNNGEKLECLVLDEDWKNTPKSFTYKLYNNSDQIVGLINNVSEFGFENSKYVRTRTKIDVSSSKTSTLTQTKMPDFVNKNLFLKLLVEGNANLYVYQNNNARLFFFNINSKNIEQLIYKKYYKSTTVIKENNQYKQQIKTHLICDDLSTDKIEALNYNTNSLTDFFIKYNACINSNYKNTITREKSTGKFNLLIKPSFNFSSLSSENKSNSLGKLDFGSNTNFGFGIETEFVLPSNNGNFSLIFEPTFQSFNSKINDYVYVETTNGNKTTVASIDYKAIDLFLGIKYYFPINKTSKIYASTLYNFNAINLGSNFDFETTSLVDLGLKGKNYFAFSLGYNFNNKITIEARLSSNQTIITNTLYSTNYNRTSIILGYNLF